MIRLVVPAVALLPHYTDALERGWVPGNSEAVHRAQEQRDKIRDDPDLFVASLLDVQARGGPVKLPDGNFVPRIPGYQKWIFDQEFCGFVAFRWQPGTTDLPPYVLGHLGYAVVPWKRRRGYATEALRLMLQDIAAIGLDFVDIVTEPDNESSQKVALANGAVLVERFIKPPVHGGTEALRFRIYLGDKNG